ncbi:hypothetical protein BAFK78_G024 (plasmid) [Borreliella afzelii K78]|nr:hypothetical protein BAFK78_G024 [Borreliella afzelii K78]
MVQSKVFNFIFYKVEKYFLLSRLCNFCDYENVGLKLRVILR